MQNLNRFSCLPVTNHAMKQNLAVCSHSSFFYWPVEAIWLLKELMMRSLGALVTSPEVQSPAEFWTTYSQLSDGLPLGSKGPILVSTVLQVVRDRLQN